MNLITEYVYAHSVDQYHYIGWPDFGAPTEVDSIIVLAKAVRKLVAENKTNSKIVVHCSAGVGRTGTFIALYHYMKILDEMVPEYKRVQHLGDPTSVDVSEMTIDIFNHVFDLRKQRCEMVSQNNNSVSLNRSQTLFKSSSSITLYDVL